MYFSFNFSIYFYCDGQARIDLTIFPIIKPIRKRIVPRTGRPIIKLEYAIRHKMKTSPVNVITKETLTNLFFVIFLYNIFSDFWVEAKFRMTRTHSMSV